MIFNPWTFLFQAINFVVLAYILHRLLYRPLHEAIDRRREENSRPGPRRRSRHEAVALQQQLNVSLAEIETQRQETLRQARELAEAERRKILSEAEQVVKRRREEAEQELRRDRDEAYRTLRQELVQSAVGFADRLLREAADSSLHRQLVARLIGTLRELPEEERERLRGEWQSDEDAVLETAEPCDGPILKQIEGSMAELAGHPVSLTVQTPPRVDRRRPAPDRRPCLGCDPRRSPGRGATGHIGGQPSMTSGFQPLADDVRKTLDAVHWRVGQREVGCDQPSRRWRGVCAGSGFSPLRRAVEHADGLSALAFDLRAREVGLLFLDPSGHVSAGDEVHATGRVASVEVGEELLGRVVDARSCGARRGSWPRCTHLFDR